MNTFVIYTAIVGNYDDVIQPLVVDERFDYILFSNDIKEKKVGVWQVRPICYNNNVKTKIARWVKTHPEELLFDYRSSLWIDANIQIASRNIYERCIELLKNGDQIASVRHPERNCIYDESVFCILAHLDSETTVIPWLHQLYKEGFPVNNGLTETGILFRIHNATMRFDQIWWDCIKNHSRRDQMSFDYVLWRTGMTKTYFFPDGKNARNSTWVNISINHKNGSHRDVPFTVTNYPFLFHYHNLFPYKNYWNCDFNNLYAQLYTKWNPLMHAHLKGLYYWAWLKIWKPLKLSFKS